MRTRQVSRVRRGQVCGAKEKAEETGGVGERECVFVLCRKREPVSQGGKEGGREGGKRVEGDGDRESEGHGDKMKEKVHGRR